MTLPKKPKKRSRKSLIREADRVFSIYIRMRDGYRCVTCGETNKDKLTCGHLFSREHHSTRWDGYNAFCQCNGCNLRHEHDPFALTTYYLSRFGQIAYDEIHVRYSRSSHFKDSDLLNLIDLINGEIDILKERNQ